MHKENSQDIDDSWEDGNPDIQENPEQQLETESVTEEPDTQESSVKEEIHNMALAIEDGAKVAEDIFMSFGCFNIVKEQSAKFSEMFFEGCRDMLALLPDESHRAEAYAGLCDLLGVTARNAADNDFAEAKNDFEKAKVAHEIEEKAEEIAEATAPNPNKVIVKENGDTTQHRRKKKGHRL